MKKTGPRPTEAPKKTCNKLNIYDVDCLYWYKPLNKITMKTSKLVLLTLLSVAVVLLSSCKKDEDPDESSFVGDYVLVNAVLAAPLTMTTNEIGDITLDPPFPVTAMLQEALLGEIDCDAESSLIELHEDFSIVLSCATSMEEINAGTWEEQSETVLVLNLNSTAIPSSPTGIVLTVIDVSFSGSTLSGTTTVPVSREMIAVIVAAMTQGAATLNMEVTPEAVPMTFTIELEKQ
jgi:hypothetical protein